MNRAQPWVNRARGPRPLPKGLRPLGHLLHIQAPKRAQPWQVGILESRKPKDMIKAGRRGQPGPEERISKNVHGGMEVLQDRHSLQGALACIYSTVSV